MIGGASLHAIVLADAQSFRLGPVEVDPPNSEVHWADQREILQPRVMQVLVVLAERRGLVVSHNDLTAACWNGRVVGDDALQRCIARLRKLAGRSGGFTLETIPRIGYRLQVNGAAPPPQISTPRVLVRLSLAVIVAGIFGFWLLAGRVSPLADQSRIPVIVRTLATSSGGDATQVALANGITDELIVRLRRIPQLQIASAEEDGSAPSNDFQQAFVFEGTIRRGGGLLRVTARLIDNSGEILWTQSFDGPVGGMFDVHETMAAAIADTLSVSFDIGPHSSTAGGTDNPQAYAAYIQAKAHVLDPDQSVPESHLQRALALDPDYSKALNALSVSYGLQANEAATKERALELLTMMDESTSRAIAANPNLWTGHYARTMYFVNRRDFAAAERSSWRMEALDDATSPDLRTALAGYQLNLGRTRRALSLIDAAAAVDPVSGFASARVWAFSNLGQNQAAIDYHSTLRSRDPAAALLGTQFVFWSYLDMGREAEAIAFADQHIPRLGAHLRTYKANAALLTMSKADLRKWALAQYGEGGYVPLVNTALFASHYGHPAAALRLLEVAYERPGAYGIVALWFPVMAQTRRTPGFAKFVTDVGLARMWRQSGDWGDYCRPTGKRGIACS